jgi:predicted regulator of Ras-like GTPase activity (Roadblock/LC7/MglB family)
MTVQNTGSVDIFEGAEKIEVMGRLPALLWAFIDAIRHLLDNLKTSPGQQTEAVHEVTRLLDVLVLAAHHIGNIELKTQLSSQAEMVTALINGGLSGEDFIRTIAAELPKLEQLAGPRRDQAGEGLIDKVAMDKHVDMLERIKSGRSADIVVSVDILDDVRAYLSSEVMTEGISSVLVIDNAGSLIVSIGDKSGLDVISLAAVAAANFAATEQIARLIGERDFVLLFYKGHNESFHFSRVGGEYIIVTIFNNTLSLGLLRLKIAEVAQVLEKKLPKRQG